MSEEAKMPTQLLMRGSLTFLPPLDLPNDMTIRCFRDGDEAVWNHIITVSFETPIDFDNHMRNDPAYAPERVLFACIEGVPVATASAWHKPAPLFGADCGYLHMVGALPEYKGRKLGYFASLAAMYRMKEEGYARVVLHTDDFRLPAIKTYLNLGYEVDVSIHESMPERWEQILHNLNR